MTNEQAIENLRRLATSPDALISDDNARAILRVLELVKLQDEQITFLQARGSQLVAEGREARADAAAARDVLATLRAQLRMLGAA